MSKHPSAVPALRSLLCAAGFLVVGAPLHGQEVEGVVVEAVREVTIGRTSSGVPVKEVSIRHRVSYADLDLATDAGAQQLEQRIRQSAKSACQELDQKYPHTVATPGKSCVDRALGDAMAQAREVIGAAKRRAVASQGD